MLLQHRNKKNLPGRFRWRSVWLLLHLACFSKVGGCSRGDQFIHAPLHGVLDGDVAHRQTGRVQNSVVTYPPTTPACGLGCCFSIGSSCTSRKDTVGFILGTRCFRGLVAVVFIRFRGRFVKPVGPLVFPAVWGPQGKRGRGNVVHWFWWKLCGRFQLSAFHLFWQQPIIRGRGLEVSATTWFISGLFKGGLYIRRGEDGPLGPWGVLIIRGGCVWQRGHACRFLVAIWCTFEQGFAIFNNLLFRYLLACEWRRKLYMVT